MLPTRTDSPDSRGTLRDDMSSGQDSATPTPTPILILPNPFERQSSNPTTTLRSPARGPSPTKLRSQKSSHLRLRSDSGLGFHTNPAAFRQYTDYNQDGSVPSRPCRARSPSPDGDSSVEDFCLAPRLSTQVRRPDRGSRLLPDFSDPAVIKLVCSNPATVQRLHKFAQRRSGAADIEFLLKVGFFPRYPALQGTVTC